MYNDQGAGDAGAEDSGVGGAIRQRLGYHMEALIPLILILVIGFFLAVRFGLISPATPIIGPIADVIQGGSAPARMLIIGVSSQEVLDVLNNNPDLADYVVRDAASFGRNPQDQISQYDIVMLDQSQQSDKSVPRVLGEALEEYVKGGGKLITVMDSGIYREGAPDIVGWKSTFRSIIPVDCDRVLDNQPVCQRRLAVRGVIRSIEFDHEIMKGIEQVPADPNLKINLETFDLSVNGKEIAYIEDPLTRRTFPGIVESRLIVGKSVFFNYNPGYTPGILENTIRYLK